MSFSISALQISPGEVNVYSSGFRNLIENHLPMLRQDASTTLVSLIPYDEYRYVGDFYSLLHHLKVTQDLFWITLRLNNLHSPINYAGDLQHIVIPSKTKIKSLLTRYINTVSIG